MTVDLPMNTKEIADRIDEVKAFINKILQHYNPTFNYYGEGRPHLMINIKGVSGMHGLDELEKVIRRNLKTDYLHLANVGVRIATLNFDACDSLNDTPNGIVSFMCDLGHREEVL